MIRRVVNKVRVKISCKFCQYIFEASVKSAERGGLIRCPQCKRYWIYSKSQDKIVSVKRFVTDK